MRDYETVIIWSASIPEGDIEKGHDRVVEIIKENEGTYNGSDKWSRRILAYPIKKQTEGIYHFLKWNGSIDVTAAIDKHLKINENCLRFLTLRSDGEALSSWEDEDDAINDEIVEEDMESEDQ
ncbi:MAG: 30S ribosomal protein S6 [Candidatus Fermentibacteria bacterium]